MYNLHSTSNVQEADPNYLNRQLVNYIYNAVDISKFKYEMLQFDTDLSQLIERKFFTSVNFSGSNCLLVFAKIKDKYHSFLIERKTLSYNANKVNIQNVAITQVNLKLDTEIYKGSIFDGTYIQSKKTFVITDVYTFKGQNTVDSQLDTKLLTLVSYLNSNYNETDSKNSIKLSVNKLYTLDRIKYLNDTVIKKIENTYQVKGICFYPEKSGTKLIFLFDNKSRTDQGTFKVNEKQNSNFERQYQNFDKQNTNYNKNNYDDKRNDVILNISNIVKNESNNSGQSSEQFVPTKKAKTNYLPKSNVKDDTYVFEMIKTETVDVYYLNIVESVTKDNKARLKRKKIGLAYIPNVARSIWCSQIMEESIANVLVHCKFHPEKAKWEPYSLATAKRPSLIDDFKVLQD